MAANAQRPLAAKSGHPGAVSQCPTSHGLLEMSAFDPKRTCDALSRSDHAVGRAYAASSIKTIIGMGATIAQDRGILRKLNR